MGAAGVLHAQQDDGDVAQLVPSQASTCLAGAVMNDTQPAHRTPKLMLTTSSSVKRLTVDAVTDWEKVQRRAAMQGAEEGGHATQSYTRHTPHVTHPTQHAT